ncbi:MAG: formate dehydrogenase subunit delta [Nitratireductor sp.]|nr:formate dehydrogenase subunit delta [Nitratireductor sp.]
MSPDKLARMANQIAKFFETRPHDEAVEGVAAHISDFWEPRMRAQFFELLETQPGLFSGLVRDAAPKVRTVTAKAANA